jgi:hypothetical protein
MAFEDYLISGLGGTPRPAASAQYTIPSWLKPSGKDVRGSTPFANIALNPGTTYRLVDNTGKNDGTILASGSTPEDFARLSSIVNSQLVPKGRQADWRLQEQVGDTWNTIGGDNYNKSGLSYVADIGLPIAGALLAPLTGGASLAPFVLSGLGAAAGSALSGTLQGKSIGDIAKSAAISGIGAGLGAGALGGFGGGASSAASAGGAAAVPTVSGMAPLVSGIGGSALSSIAPEILVQASRGLGQAALSGIGGGIGSGLGSAVTAATTPPLDPEEAVVTATRQPPVISSENLLGGIGGAGLVSTIPTQTLPTAEPEKPRTLADYIRMGLGGVSTIQGLAGLLQGEQNAGGAGIGGFNPNPGTVAYQPLNRTQNAPTFDPFTYGQTGGEFRFFNDAAPQFQINQPAPSAPEKIPGFAKGGSVRKAEIIPAEVSWRDQLIDKASEYIGRRNAERLAQVADFTPAGLAFAGNQAAVDYGRGDMVGAGVGLGLAALPIPGAARSVAKKGIKAFHGSPHSFDKFDLSKIGTGEGAQAYGRGLYFAENEKVADAYRKILSGPKSNFDGKIDPELLSELAKVDYLGFDRAGQAVSAIRREPNWKTTWDLSDSEASAIERAFNKHEAAKYGGRGSMYEVGIDANPSDFVDWDSPSSGQSEKVRSALKEAAVESDMIPFLRSREGADFLSGRGVPGIKYLDAGSRGIGQGSRNYVVFDDKIISILRKYGWVPGMAIPAGAAAAIAEEQSGQSERREYASGGHVRGIGGGQDDAIHAKLSDGEYVVSAQDVSDLGDGSNAEGARRLDEMRRLIRKQAGRKNIGTIAKPQKGVEYLLKEAE